MSQIVRLAIFSRCLVIVLQLISNLLVPDHDAGVFISPADKAASQTTCDSIIETVFGGFRRWDAQYFLHIAEHGYTYENTLAFYPLYPFCVRYSTYLLQSLLPFDCSLHSFGLLVAVALNVFFFTKATTTLYRLTEYVFDDRRLARMAATLFCFNPASVFFTAPYTESLFSWLCFSVMLKCTQNRNSAALFPMALSMWCRSNGIINFGFIIYSVIAGAFKSKRNIVAELAKCVPKVFLCGLMAGIVFALPQVYYYSLYCTDYQMEMTDSVQKYGIINGYRMTGQFNRKIAPWCLYSLPFSYSYVQTNYWNVGFLHYYELKQIPNFMLAAPILTLSITNCLRFLIMNLKTTIQLGFTSRRNTISSRFVFVVHALALSLFCVFFVHIQVSTRMLASSSPVLYWICAQHFCQERPRLDYVNSMLKPKSIKTKLISSWFLGYFTIGTILFSNFLPWT